MSLNPVDTLKAVGRPRTRLTLAAIALKNGWPGLVKQEKFSETFETEIRQPGIRLAAAARNERRPRSAAAWSSAARTRRSIENEAWAGTVLILDPGPGAKTPPTLIVGRIVLPSGVTKVRRAIFLLWAPRPWTVTSSQRVPLWPQHTWSPSAPSMTIA